MDNPGRARRAAAAAETLLLLGQMAVRNLFAARLKTLIVGSIVFAGAALIVVGNSLLDSVSDGMRKSIIESLAGDLQVYSADSKDKLEIYGGMGGFPDLARIPDFPRVRRMLLSVPNVDRVVPMGINGSMVSSGNVLDRALERLRDAVRERKARRGGKDTAAEIASRKALVRRMVGLLEADLVTAAGISDDRAATREALRDVRRALAPAFWAGFDADRYPALEYLENKDHLHAAESDMLFLGYVGTDPEAFRTSFSRFEIVEGTMIPPGRRGILLGTFHREEMMKVKIARRLDQIKEAREIGGRLIAKDPELKRFVNENKAQVHEILYQLDPRRAAEAETRLRRSLGSPELDLPALLGALLETDDANFGERYRIFYADVAPLIDLYRIRVGDMVTIKSVTRSGYAQSVNIRVWGTYQFRGLERSHLASSMNIMDLVSFGQLAGFPTSETSAEIGRMRAAAGARTVSRERAEDELFGGGAAVVADATARTVTVPDRLGPASGAATAETYAPRDLERAAVMNAAIFLKDPGQARRTARLIEAAAKREGVPLKAISWQAAAGLLGQLVLLMRMVLHVAAGVIFLVAMIVLSNAFVMATLERVRDIGTLRSLGARRGFAFAMIVVEAAVIGLLFGGAGAIAGGAIVEVIGRIGIPAKSDVMFFFFSGPRLQPFLRPSSVVLAAGIVFVVNALSAAYPAWLAARVTPRQAMATED